jgi:hypothetical protein
VPFHRFTGSEFLSSAKFSPPLPSYCCYAFASCRVLSAVLYDWRVELLATGFYWPRHQTLKRICGSWINFHLASAFPISFLMVKATGLEPYRLTEDVMTSSNCNNRLRATMNLNNVGGGLIPRREFCASISVCIFVCGCSRTIWRRPGSRDIAFCSSTRPICRPSNAD